MYQTMAAERAGTRQAVRGRHASRGRTRLTIAEGAILALMALVLAAAAVGPSLMRSADVRETETVKVSQNESLWSIAAGNPVDGLTTAQTVHLIKEMNGLTESVVVDGQLLTVPSHGDAAAMAGR